MDKDFQEKREKAHSLIKESGLSSTVKEHFLRFGSKHCDWKTYKKEFLDQLSLYGDLANSPRIAPRELAQAIEQIK